MNSAASSVKNYGCCIHRRFTLQNVSHSESALADEESKVGFVEEHRNSNSPKQYKFTNDKRGCLKTVISTNIVRRNL